MVTDAQVRLLRKKMAEGKTVAAAAVAAGMSERSAYAWKQGALPSETKGPRTWRTRVDPFAAVWESDVVPLLAADCEGVLEATTVVGELRRRHGDTFGPGQLRTLQRRMHEWRALHGPGKEVMFEQQHPPGREGAFDFTDASELKVTICGQLFAHLLFQFILTFSKWRWVGLAFSETFEALVHGLQDALAAIGGAPPVWRSDNLSAATHQLPGSGRELNRRFAAVLEHCHGAAGRGAAALAAFAFDATSRIQRVHGRRACVEHHSFLQPDLLGPLAIDRKRSGDSPASRCRRDLVPRQADRDDASASGRAAPAD
jgi:hypothetical protein